MPSHPSYFARGKRRAHAGATAAHETRHPTNNLYRTKDARFLILSMIGDFDDAVTLSASAGTRSSRVRGGLVGARRVGSWSSR